MIFFFENDIITLKNNLVTLSELNLKDINKLFNSITDDEIFFWFLITVKKNSKKVFHNNYFFDDYNIFEF